jgi:hypothetical protein
MSCCAFAVNAAASASKEVDSALASRARTVASIPLTGTRPESEAPRRRQPEGGATIGSIFGNRANTPRASTEIRRASSHSTPARPAHGWSQSV